MVNYTKGVGCVRKTGLLAMAAAIFLLFGCACMTPENDASPDGPEAACSVEMLDVGEGLCILAEMDGHYLLYDGGGRETSSLVVRHLRDKGVGRLDIMVASHYDEDHISGLIGVLSDIPVDRVIAPDYEAETSIFRSFQKKLADSSAELLSPYPGDRYPMGDGEILILGPGRENYEIENDRSVAVLLTFGKFRCLITGDAESKAELQMTESSRDLSADLYVAGHHGSASSSTCRFLEAVHPRYVFFSCGADNPYGHPAARVLDAVRDEGAEIFRTDRQGSVTAYTDGEFLWFIAEPCDDWAPGTVAEHKTPVPGKEEYILNQRTMRFHRPDCESAAKMNPENRVLSRDSREDLIARGYLPCGVCNP